MTSIRQITTADDLLAAGDIGRCELVRGELHSMSPASFEHGRRVTRLASPLDSYAQDHKSGIVTGAETGFLLQRNPDTVRAPDVAYIRRERIPPGLDRGYFPGAPDLAVEVLSPGDTYSETLEKVHDWLNAGTLAVWVIDPRRQRATVYDADGTAKTLEVGDVLRHPTLLPGFELTLARVFEVDG
jgi:Uma2 family endonuclease